MKLDYYIEIEQLNLRECTYSLIVHKKRLCKKINKLFGVPAKFKEKVTITQNQFNSIHNFVTDCNNGYCGYVNIRHTHKAF